MFIRGTCFARNHALSADRVFVSVGDDAKVCIWSLNGLKHQLSDKLDGQDADFPGALFKNYTPKATYASK